MGVKGNLAAFFAKFVGVLSGTHALAFLSYFKQFRT